jgi:KDO2-lipid IV(A) lauroyltransferase
MHGRMRRVSELLHPRTWPMWIGLGMLRLVSALPYKIQLAIGRTIGRLGRPIARYRRHVAEVNLAICFPEMSERERQRLVRKHFEALGMGIMEAAMAWWAPDRKLEPLVDIEGAEHLERAQRDGRGVILLCPHVTCGEIGARLLRMKVPLFGMYKPPNNPVVRFAVERGRGKFALQYPRQRLRAIVRELEKGQTLWYSFDQTEGKRNGVLVPFFGEPKVTVTAPMRIAKMTGAAVMPFHVRRLDNGGGYKLVLRPPLDSFPSGDVEADASRIIRLAEDQARLAPEQYLWVHARFRKRPEPLSDPY